MSDRHGTWAPQVCRAILRGLLTLSGTLLARTEIATRFGSPAESPLRDGAPVRQGRRSVRGGPCIYSKSGVTRFDHFVAWLLALGLYRLARGALFVMLLAGAG